VARVSMNGRTGAAIAANAVLVFGPAAIASRGGALRQYEFGVALAGLSLAVGLELHAQSPDRILASGDPRADRAALRFNFLQGLILLATLQTMARLAATDPVPPTIASAVGGWLLIAVAAGLRSASIRHLGRHFADGFQPAATTISRSGLYSRLRHPAEIGLMLLAVGFALSLGLHAWLPV